MRNPDENLQMLLDRYSMMGPGSDPAGIDIRNANTRYMSTFSPRSGYLYGELSRHGLAHAWASANKEQHAIVETLVIDRSHVTVCKHTYDRRSGDRDRSDEAGIAYSVPIVHDEATMHLLTQEQLTAGKNDKDRERIERSYARVSQTLAHLAIADRKNDGLHQLVMQRYPQEHENLAQLYPYAGEAYGPRVNLEEMIEAGIAMHPAVLEALHTLPKMSASE